MNESLRNSESYLFPPDYITRFSCENSFKNFKWYVFLVEISDISKYN